MATKKKSTKKTGKALALPWQQALAKHAKEGKAPKEKALTGDYISIKGGKFSLGGAALGREMGCVILGYVLEKSFYDSDYVEGAKTSPACFAIGYSEDDLSPDDTSPNKQGDDDNMCMQCEFNEWGSGRGDGKACADKRRLALVVEGIDGTMELKVLNIPPTSLKNWKGFINTVETQGLHTMQCAVNIHFDEEHIGSGIPPLVFDFVKEITKEKTLQAMADTLDAATKLLEQPYDVSNYSPPTKGKKKTSKKKVAKKKTASKKKRSKFS